MDNGILYWLWLQNALGQGNAKTRLVREKYGTPESLYQAGEKGWRRLGIFTEKEIERLKGYGLKAADKTARDCERLGYTIITPENDEYPQRLLNIYNYPAVLFCKGEISFLNELLCVTIVGTRTASDYGRDTARQLARDLAGVGAAVISGGAVGIDAAAHIGALEVKGKTAAVLVCGIDTRYLVENEKLREKISQTGLVISEYPPGTPVNPRNFHIRNRIMSALSLGTVVVEASSRSGALITARHAVEQGRDIFAVPGNINDKNAGGVNKLLSDGAIPVYSAIDILKEYITIYPHKISSVEYKNIDRAAKEKAESEAVTGRAAVPKMRDKTVAAQQILQPESEAKPPVRENSPEFETDPPAEQIRRPLSATVSENAKEVYKCLTREPTHVDEIIEKAKMTAPVVLASLTELEMLNLIRSCAGRRFCAL